MAKAYRRIQQWSQWYSHFLGKMLLEMEGQALSEQLKLHYGKHAVLIGVPEQHALLRSSVMAFQYMLGPLINRDPTIHYIEGELHEFPIHSGSVDLVIVPHIFEYIDNPHQLIAEACRIVKPEGHIFILGFNPYSFWGLKKWITKHNSIPWIGNFIPKSRIIDWLGLADFELKSEQMILFRPPTRHPRLFKRLKFLEWLGSKCYKPFGGVYILQAKAKVVPLTPIRMHWQQELSGVRITSNILSRPTTRNLI